MTPDELYWSIGIVAQYYELPRRTVLLLDWTTFLQLLDHALDQLVHAA